MEEFEGLKRKIQIMGDIPEDWIPTNIYIDKKGTHYEIPWLLPGHGSESYEIKDLLRIYRPANGKEETISGKVRVEYTIDYATNEIVCAEPLPESWIEKNDYKDNTLGTIYIVIRPDTYPENKKTKLNLFGSIKNPLDPFSVGGKKLQNASFDVKPTKVLRTVVVGAVALTLLSGCFSVIETGERGVVLRFGEYKYTMNEGLNFKAPLIDSVYKLQVRDRSYNSDVEVSSKDMQTIKISSALVYSLDSQKVGDIYRRYGNNIETTIIKPTVAEIINSTIAQYPIEEFIGKRDEISQKILGTLKTRLSDIGIDIKSFLITNHDFSDDYNKAIEQKKIAEQAAITAEYNKQKAQLDSEANKYRQEGLSKYVLMEKFLDKWDGHMPKVMTSSDSNMSMILDAQDLK